MFTDCVLAHYNGNYVLFELVMGRKIHGCKDYKKMCTWLKEHTGYKVVNSTVYVMEN